LRTHDYDGLPPIETSGEQREADTRYRINASRLYLAPDVMGKRFRRTKFSARIAAEGRNSRRMSRKASENNLTPIRTNQTMR